ncbi:MAG: hypothetical protein ABI823_17825 [Bryobacteraceae bacterium]
MDSRIAIGFRAHSGWAAAVVISGPPYPPRVLGRTRVQLAEPGEGQPFHAAEQMPFDEAQAYLRERSKSTDAMAEASFQAILRDLGERPTACAILGASGRPLPDLARILKSHALIHTAEGEFFRQALRETAARHQIPVRTIPEKSLAALQPQRFIEIASLGRLLGPPWQMDQKLAALAAWIALDG